MGEWSAVGFIPDCRDLASRLSLPFDMGRGVSLSVMPDWARGAPALDLPAASGRLAAAEGRDLALLRGYSADSPGARDPDWSGDVFRSMQETVESQFSDACLAAWLAKPAPLFFSRVMHFELPGGPSRLGALGGGTAMAIHPYDGDNRMEMPDLGLARTLLARMGELPGGGAVSSALRLARAALRESVWSTRFVILWGALEALFGPAGPQEAAFRLAQRAGRFLAEARDERRRVYEEVLESFWARTRVVHGMPLTGLDAAQSLGLCFQVQEWVRPALVRVLADSALTARIDGREREAVLDEGVFG